MNIHTIHGRLVRDPELTKGTEEKNDRVKFTVAVDHSFGDGAEFIDCIMFGKRASVIDKYFHKGSEIVLTGEGRLNSYEGKDGVKRKSYTVTVREFDFCGSKNDGSSSFLSDPEKYGYKKVKDEAEPKFEEVDEGIPF